MAVEKVINHEVSGFNLEEMVKAGLHFGHVCSRLHPKMKKYIFGVRKTVHIFDLKETAQKLRLALDHVEELIRDNKKILFVGTKIQHREPVRELAGEFGFSYVATRWLGGFLTNFDVMRKRVVYWQGLRDQVQDASFAKRPKKEQARLKRELFNLTTKFAGIEKMEKLPDALFICDIRKDNIALKEAIRMKLPVIAITDSNVDPSLVDWPIPTTDDGISAAKYIFEKLRESILKAK